MSEKKVNIIVKGPSVSGAHVWSMGLSMCNLLWASQSITALILYVEKGELKHSM